MSAETTGGANLTRRPSNLVRYRELARLPPCKSLDDCPSVGDAVSDILRRGETLWVCVAKPGLDLIQILTANGHVAINF